LQADLPQLRVHARLFGSLSGERAMAEDPKKHKPDESKKKKELDIVPHPSETEDISSEMEDLFEEEIVKHKHGHAEPEGD
jgi:hypothetical protein